MRLKFRFNGHLLVNNYGDGVQWVRGPVLGKGGFGSVYLGLSRDSLSGFFEGVQPRSVLRPRMAVKSAEISNSSSLREEQDILTALAGCPHIIQYFGSEITVGCDGTVAYNLLLEYASGGSLFNRIHYSGHGGLPKTEVRWYTRSILEALAHIHHMGFVHCDLKPENILLVPRARSGGFEFTAKICDFGLSKRARGSRKRKRMKGCWRGTPMYLSPEAARDGVQEKPSDIWALGCIVLEMLTGKYPWDVEAGEDQENIVRKIGKGVAVPKIPRELSREARSFLKCCLKRMVKNRLSARTLLLHPFVDVGELSNDNDDDNQDHVFEEEDEEIAEEDDDDGQDQGFEEDKQMEDINHWRPTAEEHSAAYWIKLRRLCKGSSSDYINYCK